jgi:hypothetical protein
MGTWRVLVAVAACSPGCYAAAGPSIGLDTTTGRTTLGAELTGATVTYGFSKAVTDTPRTTRKSFRHRHYLLWEPSIGTAPGDTSRRAYAFGGLGASLGMRWERLEDETLAYGFAGGAFVAAGHMLKGAPRGNCADDNRPYVTAVFGLRGSELYFAPKLGFVHLPEICINTSLWEAER